MEVGGRRVTMIILLVFSLLCIADCSGAAGHRVADSSRTPDRDWSEVRILHGDGKVRIARAPFWEGFTLRDAVLLAPGDHDHWLPRLMIVDVRFPGGVGTLLPGDVLRDPDAQRRIVLRGADISVIVFLFFSKQRREKVVYLGGPDFVVPLVEFFDGMKVRDLPAPFVQSLSVPGRTVLLLRLKDEGRAISIARVVSTPIREEVLELSLQPYDAVAVIPDEANATLVFGEIRRPRLVPPDEFRVERAPCDTSAKFGPPGVKEQMFEYNIYHIKKRDGSWKISDTDWRCSFSPQHCLVVGGDILYYAPDIGQGIFSDK